MAFKTIGSVKIEGLKELEAALADLNKATQRNVIKRALAQAGDPMRDVAESLAPTRTGKLKKNIVLSARAINNVGKSEFGAAMRAGLGEAAARKALRDARRNSTEQSHVELFMGPTEEVWYAHFPEFGTVKMTPKPFMRPAFDQEKENVVMRVKNFMWEEIKKAAARAAKKTAKFKGNK